MIGVLLILSSDDRISDIKTSQLMKNGCDAFICIINDISAGIAL